MRDRVSMNLPRVPPVHRGCVRHPLQLRLKPFPPSLIMYGAPSRAACQVIGTRFATSALPVALAVIQTKSIYRQAEYLVEGGRGPARGGAVGGGLPCSYTPRSARRETLFYHTRGPQGVLFLVKASITTTSCCFPLLSSQQMSQSYWDQE